MTPVGFGAEGWVSKAGALPLDPVKGGAFKIH